jgi:hypothetical protein
MEVIQIWAVLNNLGVYENSLLNYVWEYAFWDTVDKGHGILIIWLIASFVTGKSKPIFTKLIHASQNTQHVSITKTNW